ncbi:MAG: hypothetical protein LBB77_06085, partial [Treponema sp.]|nr:hypothetical protein [Treponema sp.]
MNYKTKCITTFLVIIICLSASCDSGGPYLVIKTDKDTRTFGFFEEATGQEITYTKIRYNNREVYKAVFMEILNIAGSNVETGDGVYFAFDEDDYTVEQVDGQTKMTYSGGQSISSGLLWRYTLENGVLSISGKGKKPGPLTVSGRPSEKTLFQKNARATVEGFISSLKEKKYDEVQTFLTDNYDFSGDNVVFDGANYDTYVGLSEFAVAGGEYYTDYAKITVHIKRPDIFDFSNGSDVYDEFHAYTDEEKSAYAAKRFETGDYSMIEDEKVLTLLNEGGKLTIQLDEGLVGLM